MNTGESPCVTHDCFALEGTLSYFACFWVAGEPSWITLLSHSNMALHFITGLHSWQLLRRCSPWASIV